MNNPLVLFRPARARQDTAAERLRFHHGDAQEGSGLHQEAAHPQHAGGQEGRHADVDSNICTITVRPLPHAYSATQWNQLVRRICISIQ
jgi:hypothetical protein